MMLQFFNSFILIHTAGCFFFQFFFSPSRLLLFMPIVAAYYVAIWSSFLFAALFAMQQSHFQLISKIVVIYTYVFMVKWNLNFFFYHRLFGYKHLFFNSKFATRCTWLLVKHEICQFFFFSFLRLFQFIVLFSQKKRKKKEDFFFP